MGKRAGNLWRGSVSFCVADKVRVGEVVSYHTSIRCLSSGCGRQNRLVFLHQRKLACTNFFLIGRAFVTGLQQQDVAGAAPALNSQAEPMYVKRQLFFDGSITPMLFKCVVIVRRPMPWMVLCVSITAGSRRGQRASTFLPTVSIGCRRDSVWTKTLATGSWNSKFWSMTSLCWAVVASSLN